MCIPLDAIKEKRVADLIFSYWVLLPRELEALGAIMVYTADKYSPNKPMDHFVGKDISSPAELM